MDTINYMGRKIREIRKAQKISQEKLAELTDLHPTYISHIENGKVNPTISIIISIAEALDVHVYDLIEVYDRDRYGDIEVRMNNIKKRIIQISRSKQRLYIKTMEDFLRNLEEL